MSEQKPADASASPQGGLGNVLALATQLNRQAFANPPTDGWLNAFLGVVLDQFRSQALQGLQVAQVIGNIAISVGVAGDIPAGTTEQFTINPTSAIATTVRTHETTTSP